MGGFRDLTGQRFGRLLVKHFANFDTHHSTMWVCLCDCGKTHIASRNNLTSGHTKSCGCLAREIESAQMTKHGGKKTRLYNIWCSIKTRCYNKNCEAYINYGGRGISVCKEWKNDFNMFREWAMCNGYSSKLSIDRINNNKGYCPNNCRWVTRKEQNNNKRDNRIVEFNGQKHTLAQWCKELGLKYHVVYLRIYRHKWDIARALTTPTGSR